MHKKVTTAVAGILVLAGCTSMNPTGPRYDPVVSAPTSAPAPAPAPDQAPSKASGNGGNGNGGKVAHVRAPRDSQSLRRYRRDLRNCKYVAKRRMGTAESGVAGALGGGAIGAALGSALGATISSVEIDNAAAAGAASGGILGGAGGALAGNQSAKRLLARCMMNRGWNVTAK